MADLLCAAELNIRVKRYISRNRVRGCRCGYDWIELDKRMVIQGLLAERDKETRVYVVTINTPPEYAWIHDRWPRLVRLTDQ